MNLDTIDLFSTLTKEEKAHISNFFQEHIIKKGTTFLNTGDDLNGAYLLLKGQIIVSNDAGKWLWFINENSIIWVSIIYDYSKREKKIPAHLKAYQDCIFLIMPTDIIKNLTDKDRVIFKKVIDQIKEEKRIF